MTERSAPPPGFDATIRRWREGLLDFTGRNRMLAYREQARTVRLYVPERDAWVQTAVEGREVGLDDGVLLPPPSPAPPDATTAETAAAREERRKQREEAERRLRTLAELQRTSIEEQGVHVLHIPVGWLDWVDPTKPPDRQRMRSPLLFVPVSTRRTTAGWRLGREPGEDIEHNITLAVYLQQQLGIPVKLPGEDADDLDGVMAAWQAVATSREGWRVSLDDAARLDAFSFRKIAIFDELGRSLDRVRAQPVLMALCGDPALLGDASLTALGPLDEIPAADVPLVVPADGSQLEAIVQVQRGKNLVIQGPPGTGKSQTITNLIADALAAGKRVLFVAEKMAARTVVVDNLGRAGLGELALHITGEAGASGRQARTAVLDQLAESLRLGRGSRPRLDGIGERVDGLRADSNRYVERLHRPVGPWPRSTPFLLMGHAAATGGDDADFAPGLPHASAVTDGWLDEALAAADAIDRLGEATLTAAAGPWLATPHTAATPSQVHAARAALQTLAGFEQAAVSATAAHGLRLQFPVTPGSLGPLAATLDGAADHALVSRGVLRFVRPRFWRTRAAARRFAAAGGMLTGSERASAGELRRVVGEADAASAALDGWHPSLAADQPFTARAAAARELLASVEALPTAARVRANLDHATRLGLEPALVSIIRARAPGESVRASLDHQLRRRWAWDAIDQSGLSGPVRQQRASEISRFAAADAAAIPDGAAAALNRWTEGRPSMNDFAPQGSDLWHLKAQVQAKRRRSLRWLFTNAPGAILQLRPCVVASPLAVAQFLQSPAYAFDIVIFDEASQVPTPDAVVPMSRGAQVVVVGDDEQMPPTSFFDAALEPGEDDDASVTFESVLNECGALLPRTLLRWHYRSQDEALIAFSNRNYYGGQLLTFPAAWAARDGFGVRFEYVPDAVYGRGGSAANPQEAERIVTLLRAELMGRPGREVAVTALSVAQAREVQARIEVAAEVDADLRCWLDAGNRVKNLETVQGDECDVMILGFGYGKDGDGRLQANFGPLSQQGGYRRLNVAVTRARQQTIVVASIRAAEVPSTAGPGGAQVRAYLDYAERGATALGSAGPGLDRYESALEEDVANALRGRGWQVETQAGVGGYRIDLAVRDTGTPGRYLAGIECDGATYHSAQTARDRDIARQRVLERLGWNILRVWSPDWYHEKQRVADELDEALRKLGGPGPGGSEPVAEPVPGPAPFAGAGPAAGLPPEAEAWEPHRVVRGNPSGQHIVDVVAREGPLHLEELLEALRADFGIERLTARRRAGLLAAVDALRGAGVVIRGDWAWPAGMDPREVPVRVRRGGPPRPLARYSDEELLRAMEIACRAGGRIPEHQLPRAVADLLGIDLRAAADSRLGALVERAVAGGYITVDGDGMAVALDRRAIG